MIEILIATLTGLVLYIGWELITIAKRNRDTLTRIEDLIGGDRD